MKYALVIVAALATAVPAVAGQNPNVRAFVSFAGASPDPYVHYVDFAIGVQDCYLVLDGFGEGGGVWVLAFSWTTSGFGAALAPTYYWAGWKEIGGPDDPLGWVIAVPGGYDCAYPNECGIMVVVNQPYFVQSPGTITLGPHPVDGQMTLDCNFDTDLFCVLASGGIGMVAPEGDCPTVPVEPSSWGTIKSMYR